MSKHDSADCNSTLKIICSTIVYYVYWIKCISEMLFKPFYTKKKTITILEWLSRRGNSAWYVRCVLSDPTSCHKNINKSITLMNVYRNVSWLATLTQQNIFPITKVTEHNHTVWNGCGIVARISCFGLTIGSHREQCNNTSNSESRLIWNAIRWDVHRWYKFQWLRHVCI